MPRLLPQRTARFQPLPRAAASFNKAPERNAGATPGSPSMPSAGVAHP